MQYIVLKYLLLMERLTYVPNQRVKYLILECSSSPPYDDYFFENKAHFCNEFGKTRLLIHN